MRLVLFNPIREVCYHVCLLGKSALGLVDHCFHLIQYEAVITVGVFIHFRFIWFELLSCDLICTMFGARFLLWKVSILLASLAKVFLCRTGEALCMPGVSTFGTAIGTAMSLRWIEEFLLGGLPSLDLKCCLCLCPFFFLCANSVRWCLRRLIWTACGWLVACLMCWAVALLDSNFLANCRTLLAGYCSRSAQPSFNVFDTKSSSFR